MKCGSLSIIFQKKTLRMFFFSMILFNLLVMVLEGIIYLLIFHMLWAQDKAFPNVPFVDFEIVNALIFLTSVPVGIWVTIAYTGMDEPRGE